MTIYFLYGVQSMQNFATVAPPADEEIEKLVITKLKATTLSHE